MGRRRWICYANIALMILLTDLRMPRLDGIDLLKRALREFPVMPVIILTGMGTMEDVIQALRIGAFDYLTKPVHDMEVIVKATEKAILFSQQLKAEAESRDTINKLTEKLQEQRSREALILHAKKELERTIDSMSEMVAVVDKNNTIVRVNKPFQEKMGLSFQEILGKPCFFCEECERVATDQCPHAKTIQDGLIYKNEIYEKNWESYLEVTTVPYSTAEGSIGGSVHIIRDISEQRKAEQEKEKLQAKLLHAEKMKSVGLLAAGIAHEINTPTQYVGSNIEFIEEAAEDITSCMDRILAVADVAPAPIKDKLVSIIDDVDWDFLKEELPQAITQSRDGITRVVNIVQAMKEFSHPGSREKIAHNLNRIIESTITVASNEWKYAAKITKDFEDPLPMVPLLIDEMGQVILNILVNAVHAISEKLGDNPDGLLGEIAISTRSDENGVELCIKDSGNGMTEEVQKHIFDPFYTTKEVGKGTGQGLAISHDVIVDKHQGSITVESKQGEGTLFRIRLPFQGEKVL